MQYIFNQTKLKDIFDSRNNKIKDEEVPDEIEYDNSHRKHEKAEQKKNTSCTKLQVCKNI